MIFCTLWCSNDKKQYYVCKIHQKQIKIIKFFSRNLSVVIVSISTAAMTENNNTFTVCRIVYFNVKIVVVMCLHLNYFCLLHNLHTPGNSEFLYGYYTSVQYYLQWKYALPTTFSAHI